MTPAAVSCRISAPWLAALLLMFLACAAQSIALAADQAPPRQTVQDANKAFKELMKAGHAAKGLTTRGQSLADAPPFTVLPRKSAMDKFPCTNCHDNVFVDRRVRQLKDEHQTLVFDHGGGRFWCYDACHNGKDMNHLVSLRRTPIDYNRSYRLCGQCHFEREKDWAFGGHGRRAGAWPQPAKVPLTHSQLLVKDRDTIGKWQGVRVLLNCTACHDPHSPAIKSYVPSPPPPVRTGLERGKSEPLGDADIWVRLQRENKGGK